MKKYRKKRGVLQRQLAEMLDTSASYIGETEICAKVPSLGMVEKIAQALDIEPFRLFVDDASGKTTDSYLERLSTTERQGLAKHLITTFSHSVQRLLAPEAVE